MVAIILPGRNGPMIGGGTASGAATTTFNPSDKAANISLDATNLIVTNAVASNANVRSIASHSSGKYYCEATITQESTNYTHGIGVANSGASLTAGPGSPDTNSVCYYNGDSNVYSGNVNRGSLGASYTFGDVVSMAVDIGNNRIWYRINGGNWNGSGTNDPATNVGGKDISNVSGPFFVIASAQKSAANSITTFNFGGSAYSYTAPSGFGNW